MLRNNLKGGYDWFLSVFCKVLKIPVSKLFDFFGIEVIELLNRYYLWYLTRAKSFNLV